MKKLLIVDDDHMLVKLYQKRFQLSQFVVEVAHTGEQGINIMRTFQPDIVLLDIILPKLNGFEVLDIIKKDHTIKHISVVMFTNLSTSEDKQLALQKGALNYLVKSDHTPIDLVEKVVFLLQYLPNTSVRNMI